jgi:hypothetical protein
VSAPSSGISRTNYAVGTRLGSIASSVTNRQLANAADILYGKVKEANAAIKAKRRRLNGPENSTFRGPGGAAGGNGSQVVQGALVAAVKSARGKVTKAITAKRARQQRVDVHGLLTDARRLLGSTHVGPDIKHSIRMQLLRLRRPGGSSPTRVHAGRDPQNLQSQDSARPRRKGNGKGGKRRSQQVTVMGGASNERSSFSPISSNLEVRNATYQTASVNIRHNVLGLPGVRLSGCQPFSTANLFAAGGAISSGTLATAYNANSILVDPDHLNGPLATQASFHERYCFRELSFEYISALPTTTPGDLCMAYAMDPDINDLPSDFAEVREIDGSVTCAVTRPAKLQFRYTGQELWYIGKAAAGNSIATDRQQTQGIFSAFASVPADTPSAGYYNIRYVIEMFESVPLQSISAFVCTNFERSLIKDALAAFRKKYNNGKKVSRIPDDSKASSTTSDGFELVPH